MTTSIEWTNKVWNPLAGCTPVSPGCVNCYAARMAMRLEGMGTKGYQPVEPTVDEIAARHAAGVNTLPSIDKRIRIAEVRGGRPVFTGSVRMIPDKLTDPLHWRAPKMIFVNSMSDLFHEAVPFDFIDQVFAVMALCPQHTFQVLTKRPERMAEYTGDHKVAARIWDACIAMNDEVVRTVHRTIDTSNLDHQVVVWPLPNVWLGTSVEDQERANQRIPHLLKCPAAVRFLSCEPLLGMVDLSAFFGGPYVGLPGDVVHPNYNFGINWVIAGGESGAKSRPCNIEWIRSIVQQCKAAAVPCFVKQLGAKPMVSENEVLETYTQKGNDPIYWPEDLRVREMPAGTTRE